MSHQRMEARRNELLEDVMACVHRALVEHDVADGAAMVAASAVADRLADQWGGQNISFPKDYRWKLSQVELEIYDRFDGTNFDVLAHQHGMTERGVRKLIARVRSRIAARAHEAQNDMFVA